MREVPALLDCPTCGLPCEAGHGPGNLAWHDCGWVLERATARQESASQNPYDIVMEAVASAVREKARDMTGRDLAALVAASAERPVEQSTGSISDELRQWLESEVPDDAVDA